MSRLWLIYPLIFLSVGFALRAQQKPPGQTLTVEQPEQKDQKELRGRHPAESTARYHRFICLMHLTGSGKAGDPMRPEYAPSGDEQQNRAGIVSWSMQLTDNKNMAIVHYVAVDRAAFQGILNDKRGDIKVFEIGRDKPEEIEKEMRKHKKDFQLADFQVVAQ